MHPFLLSAYPVLALLAHNITQIVPVFAVRSIIIALVATGLVFVISRCITRDWYRAAMITSLGMLLFFTYGYALDAMQGISLWGISFGRHRVLVASWSIILFLGAWLIVKKVNAPFWTQVLNATGLIAVCFSLSQIGWYFVKTQFNTNMYPNQGTRVDALSIKPPDNQTLPDLYYIVLDTYTRQDTLSEYFNFDNSAFTTYLREKGFYVADCAQSNYHSTILSLASSLNMNYLAAVFDGPTLPNHDETVFSPYLANNSVWHALDSLGYIKVAVDSGYSPTNFGFADLYLSQANDIRGGLSMRGVNAFELLLIHTSAGRIYYDHIKNDPDAAAIFDYAYMEHRNRILYALDRLEEMPALEGPKFVFVHILAPHNPFVFGPNGEVIIRWSPFTLDNDLDALGYDAYIDGFVGQVEYLNKRVARIIDELLLRSEPSPIIIIQGDHGSPRTPGWNNTILSAYYLPGANGTSMLYPSISPVNTFRVVFNAYFGAQLPLLIDQACASDPENLSSCIPVPDPNPECRITP